MSVLSAPPGILIPNAAPMGYARSYEAYRGPDPYKVKEQLQLLQSEWKTRGPADFMARFCWIQPKPPEKGERVIKPTNSPLWNRNLIPFYINNIQKDIERRLGNRNIFLKPRQGGYTTYMIIRRLLLACILNPGHNGLLIAQKSKSASDYFRILKRAFNLFAVSDPFDKGKNALAKELHRHLLHTVYSNRRELVFDQLDLAIRCESAEVEEVGQGYTYMHVVASEVARWEHNPEATLSNLKESIPKGGTFDMESTANGYGGYFFEECMRARNVQEGVYREFTYHFHPWWFHEEYKDEEPVEEATLTKEEQRLLMTYGEGENNVDLHKLAWRRRKKEELRQDFDEKYPEDDITCFLLTGGQFFDREILKTRHMELMTYKPRELHDKLTIFKKEKPHRRYIIGVDVAEGTAADDAGNDLDWSCAYVIDEETGEECASYRDQVIPEELGWDMAALGKRYNDALIAVERNEDGGAVILTLEVACMYMNLYKHRDWWKKDWRKSAKTQPNSGGESGKIREILGWPTTKKTRPIALNRLRHFITECPELIYDIGLVEECLTFTRNPDKRGRPEASKGCHDDRVLAKAIALAVRQIRLGYLVPEALPPKERYGQIPTEFQADEQTEE